MNHFAILKSLHDYLIRNAIKSIFQYILQTIHPSISHSTIHLILYNVYCKKNFKKKIIFTIKVDMLKSRLILYANILIDAQYWSLIFFFLKNVSILYQKFIINAIFFLRIYIYILELYNLI